MQRFVSHIAHVLTVTALMLSVVAVLTVPALADKSKKVVDRNASRNSADQVIKYGSPTVGAVNVVVSAMNRKQSAKTSQNSKLKITNDTSRRESRILFATVAADVFKTRVDITSDQQQIDVGIYNMLGKRMTDVYVGAASRGEHDYTLSVSDLPEGVYICILQGSNFRRAEKFYLNR